MNQPTAVGAHIYAGGFTEGMRQHLNVLGHLETSRFGTETARLNLKLHVEVDPSLQAWPWPAKVDVIYTNPPCSAWSRLGHKQYLDHPSIADTRACIALGTRQAPDIFVWECVTQAWTMGQAFVLEMAQEFIKVGGYKPYILLTDSWLHGAAQRRQRFHLVCSKVDLRWETPNLPGATCGHVLRGMNPEVDPKNLQVRKYLQWMGPYALPGYALRKIWFWLHGLNPNEPKPEGMRFCPPFCIQRLHGDRPSCTLTGGPDFVHPYEWRVLSPGEMAALSGYPSSWKWVGPMIERYKQVAKGVTPAAGSYLGRVLAEGLNRGKGVESWDLEVIDQRPQADEVWRNFKPSPFPPEWVGIAENNQLKPGVAPCSS